MRILVFAATVLAALVVSGSAPALGATSFAVTDEFPFATGEPSHPVMADFDGDGVDDVATFVFASPSKVSVRLGDVDGGLGDAALYEAGGSFGSFMATADLTGDGELDLVVSNIISDDFSLLPGNGSGGFGAPQQRADPAVVDPERFVLEDFDGDDDVDVAVSGAVNTVVFMANNGDGTFAAGVAFAVGTKPYDLAVGDFNEDSRPDLAVANSQASRSVSILLGQETGPLFAAQTVQTPTYDARLLAVGDLDGDGHDDVVATSSVFSNATISVLRGDGSGGFAPGAAKGLAGDLVQATTEELDGDNGEEILLAYFGNVATTPSGIIVGGLAADGSLQLDDPIPVAEGVAGPLGFAAGFLGGDDEPDLAVARQENVLTLLTGDALTLEPAAIDFGEVAIGAASGARTLVAENVGIHPVALGASGFDGPDSETFDVVADACAGKVLVSGARCELRVAFSPDAAGEQVGLAVLDADTIFGGSAAFLAGEGFVDGRAKVSPTPGRWPGREVGAAPYRQGTGVYNRGERDLKILDVRVLAPGGGETRDFGLEYSTCAGQILRPGDRYCALMLQFHPRHVGPVSGQLVVVTDGTPAVVVEPLNGTGLDGTALAKKLALRTARAVQSSLAKRIRGFSARTLSRRKSIRIPGVQSSVDGRLRIRLTATVGGRRQLIATSSTSLRRKQKGTPTLKLTTRGRRLLRKGRIRTLRADIAVTPADFKTFSLRATLKLRRSR